VSVSQLIAQKFRLFATEKLQNNLYVSEEDLQREFLETSFTKVDYDRVSGLQKELRVEMDMSQQSDFKFIEGRSNIDDRPFRVYALQKNESRAKIHLYREGKIPYNYSRDIEQDGIRIVKDGKDFGYSEDIGQQLLLQVLDHLRGSGYAWIDSFDADEHLGEGAQRTQNVSYYFDAKDSITYKLQSAIVTEPDGIGDAHGPDKGGTSFHGISVTIKGKNIEKVHSSVEELEKLLEIKSQL